QHPARLGGLDKAQGRHRLAGTRGVLEPEALGGVGVLGLLREGFLLVLVHPVARLLVGFRLLLGLVLGLVLILQLLLELVVLVLVLLGGGALDGTEVVVLLVVLLVLLVLLGPFRLALARLRDTAVAVGLDVLGAENGGRREQLGRGRGRP